MELQQYIFNAISDYNDSGVADDEHGNPRYTQKQMADMAEYFADFASMVG